MLRGDEVGLDTLTGEEKQLLGVEHAAVLDPPCPLTCAHLGCEQRLDLSLKASSPFSLKMSLMQTLSVSAATT